MTEAAQAWLRGIDVDPDDLVRWATRTGLASGPGDGDVIILWGRPGDVADPTLWTPPVVGWIEVVGADDAAAAERLVGMREADLFASFTTATANLVNLPRGLALALAARRPIDHDHLQEIEFALHEAIGNAIIHGNLGIASIKSPTVANLDAFSRQITERLADPKYAARRVDVQIKFQPDHFSATVNDEGPGYPDWVRPPESVPYEPSGRGLELIGAMAHSWRIDDVRRSLTMVFEW